MIFIQIEYSIPIEKKVKSSQKVDVDCSFNVMKKINKIIYFTGNGKELPACYNNKSDLQNKLISPVLYTTTETKKLKTKYGICIWVTRNCKIDMT